MSQTTYDYAPSIACAGQLVEYEAAESYIAAEIIPAGRAVELQSDGSIKLPQSTTLGTIVGVSMYSATREYVAAGEYAVGEVVPVLRKGKIYADWTGTTHVAKGPLNIRHSSTIATHRGKLTDAATSAGAGTEISAGPDGVIDDNAQVNTSLVLVVLNLPA